MSRDRRRAGRLTCAATSSVSGTSVQMVSGRRAVRGRLAPGDAVSDPERGAEGSRGCTAGHRHDCLRCLRKDPSRRFQHMSDVKVAIDEVRESSETAGLAAATRGPSEAAPDVVVDQGRGRRRGGRCWRCCVVAGRDGAAADHCLREGPADELPALGNAADVFPDGRQVAFSWNGEAQVNYDIWVKLVDGDTPLQLTRDPSDDTYPTWSPDGRFIAFVRRNAYYRISPLGGVERKNRRCGRDVPGLDDGRQGDRVQRQRA